jgi:hypothetical protein
MSQDTSLLLSPFQLLNRINPYAGLHPKASAMSFSLPLQNIPLVYWFMISTSSVIFVSETNYVMLCLSLPQLRLWNTSYTLQGDKKIDTYECTPSRMHSELWLHNNASHHVIFHSMLKISRCTPGVVIEEFHFRNTLSLWLGLRCIINAYTSNAPVGRLVCYGDWTDWVANLQTWKSPLSALWYGHRMILCGSRLTSSLPVSFKSYEPHQMEGMVVEEQFSTLYLSLKWRRGAPRWYSQIRGSEWSQWLSF